MEEEDCVQLTPLSVDLHMRPALSQAYIWFESLGAMAMAVRYCEPPESKACEECCTFDQLPPFS